ncbi:phosphodiester glycosidase family protein [Microbacterium sp. G2-8]|uniref:phosphodiester glycosidase family protein n=1 Tax=Microbacterium sp. G2-8 TaxID=2842454 RepID=UPI001C8A6F04|nr:phosphodiester glycosidase family protein [Microbacterium sp. G2-8]
MSPVRTTAALVGVTLAASLLAAAPAQAAANRTPVADDTLGLDLAGGSSALLDASSHRIAPGLDHVEFSRMESGGWVTGDVLVADLTTPTLSMDVLDSGSVAGVSPVSEQVEGSGAVAAVNGDYFDMNRTGAPVGTNVSSEGLRTAGAGAREAFTVTDGIAAVQRLMAEGSLTTDDGVTDIDAVNAPSIPANGVGVYTTAWGDFTLDYPVGAPGDLSDHVMRATVVDGVVTDVADGAGDPAIPTDGHVLVGREDGADAIGALEVGDAVDIAVGPSADVDLAVSGSQRLVIDGEKGTADQVEASRTAIGVNRDGTEIYVVAIDGRADDSRGQTVQELAHLMLDLGAHNAVNLDGGGSTTMLARPAGTTDLELVNRPSDGSERSVANSLAFFSRASEGPTGEAVIAPRVDGADRIFPGLDRTLDASVLDGDYAGLPADGRFSSGGAVKIVSDDSGSLVVTGKKAGLGDVTYKSKDARGKTTLRVLGDLERITASETSVSMLDQQQTAALTLTGHDGDGSAAPIEASDIEVSAGPEVTIEQNGLGEFVISPAVASGSTTITFTVAGHTVEVPATIGLTEEVVRDFSDADSWGSATARASGEITATPGEGPDGQDAMALDYDFTQSTATRGFYAIAPDPVELPGQPQAVTLWINGDGSGAWPRLQVRPAGSTSSTNLDGPNVTWEGWKKVEFTVPEGTAYPLTFERIRMMEIRSTASYQGAIQVADLGTISAPEVEQPAAAPVKDPLIVADGTADDRETRIAVMGDAQFVARNPDSDIVEAARRTLREIVAAEPDLLVIGGDLVDEASPEDFALATRILDEEVGDALPYVYVPGNHEIMGGEIANFEAAFGDTRTTQDIGATRIVTLNSAPGTLGSRGERVDQLQFLEEQLAGAADDDAITGVTVFFHHPTEDHLVGDHSQLSDRVEARELEATAAEFRESTGKSIAVVNGHVGNFSGRSADGVSYLTVGNSGKGPSGPVDLGGFTGWAMLGIDPDEGVVGAKPKTVTDRTEWLQAEVRPRVDGLSLSAVPSTLAVGESVTVDATIDQDGARDVPVAWPVSAQWNVDGDAIELDVATGELTAVAPGAATVTVTVNGVSVEATITVE